MTATLKHSTKLLMVDDDPIMVRLLAKVIERAFGNRIELHCLTDAAEARCCIQQGLFDILLTDLEMPGVSGLELLRWMRRKNPAAQVLFITGHSTLESLTDALELGATDYLLKPVDQAELIHLLQDADHRLRRWRNAFSGTVAAKHEIQTPLTHLSNDGCV